MSPAVRRPAALAPAGSHPSGLPAGGAAFGDGGTEVEAGERGHGAGGVGGDAQILGPRPGSSGRPPDHASRTGDPMRCSFSGFLMIRTATTRPPSTAQESTWSICPSTRTTNPASPLTLTGVASIRPW